MLVKLLSRTLILVLAAISLLASLEARAGIMTADKYLATKKSLGAVSCDLSSLKNAPKSVLGKTIELTGKINGTVKSGGNLSFLFVTDDESFVVKTHEEPSASISNGSILRILVKVGPDSITSLSDLNLKAVAYDSVVSTRERQLAEKSKPKSAAPYRGSDPAIFLSANQGRGANLSSRARQIYDPYRSAIAGLNPRLTAAEVDSITSSILGYSEKYGVDPRLIIAVILTESRFNPNATSRRGAMGLAQLMPGTARGMGVDNAYNPEQNISASVRLMRGNLDKFGDLALALSAYNAGAGAVKRHGGIPPYRETRNYIAKVTSTYNALCGKN